MKKRKLFLGLITFIALCISACGGGKNPLTFSSSSLDKTSEISSSIQEPSKSSSSLEEKSSSSSLVSSSSLAELSSSSSLKSSSAQASSSSSQLPSSSSLNPSSSSSNKPSSSSSLTPSSSSSQKPSSSASQAPSSSSSNKPSSNSSQTPSSSSSNKPSSSSSSSSSSSQKPSKVTIDIFALNDMHGNVKDTAGKGIGIAKSTTAFKGLSKDKNSIFISEGDMWQGSVESNYTRGNLVTEWMNNMNFVSMTVGNHEFDWGQEYIVENGKLANFPFLGINVISKNTWERVDYLQPSATFTRGDAKIGVIGAIGNCLKSISSSYVQDVYFATGDELTNLVKAESTRLRNEEKCDFIIYSIHGAGNRDSDDSYDLDLSNDHYVDIVLEGHSHDKYCYQDYAGVYHLQGGANNEGAYQITVDLDLTAKTSNVHTPEFIDLSNSYSSYRFVEEDQQTNELFEKYKSAYEFAYENLGYNSYWRGSNELRQIIADQYLKAGLKKWGNQYNIILGGGYLSCRGSGLAVGEVIYAQIDELFPFDNDVELCSILGRDLKNTSFIRGDSNYYFMSWSDYGSSVRFDIDDYTTYYLVADKYGSDYAPNHLTVVDKLGDEIYARDLLAEYIREGNMDDRTQMAHAGTLDDPRTIEEARQYASEHPGTHVNNSGSEGFYYTGVVSQAAVGQGSSTGDLYSVYVKDADKDNEMLIYYLKKSYDTATYGNWSSKEDLKVGDVLVFWGKAFNYYSSTLEFASGAYVVTINGTPTAN